jgi:hypothetical protein
MLVQLHLDLVQPGDPLELERALIALNTLTWDANVRAVTATLIHQLDVARAYSTHRAY